MSYKFLVRTAALAVLASASAGHAAATFYGLTSAQSGRNLVSFSSEMPGMFTSNVAITGDVTRAIDLFSLDLNSSNNMLYALGSIGSGEYALFSIGYDGVATRIGANLGVNIGTENVGLDYDASANIFRVVTNDDRLFLIDPNTGLASAGQGFGYAAGDPLGGQNPNVVAAAYNGSFYVLDRNGPRNGGLLSTLDGTTLTSVSAVDRRLNANTSFDIAANGEAYFNDGQVADRLYQLNLADGTTIDKGALQARLTGLTAAPGAVPEPAAWAMMIAGFGLVGTAMRRRRTTITFA